MFGARAGSRQKRNGPTFVWDTRNTQVSSSSGNQITLPLHGTEIDFEVYWGDGTKDHITAFDQAEATHTYTDSGIYETRMSSGIGDWDFNNAPVKDQLKLLHISSFKDLVLRDSQCLQNCSNLTVKADNTPIFPVFESADSLFMDCNLGTGPHVENFDFQSATTLRRFVNNNVNFDGDLSNWDVSNIDDFFRCFDNTSFTNGGSTGINNWDTSAALSIYDMFRSGPFNQPIGNWDVSNVTNMRGVFQNNAVFNQDIGSWNTSSVTSFQLMFGNDVVFNQDLSNWNIGNANNLQNMFQGCDVFNNGGSTGINNWNTSGVTDMNGVFDGANAFNQPIGNWDVSNATSFFRCFQNCFAFDQDLSNWVFATGTGINISMASMFRSASAFNNSGQAGISGWNTTRVTTMRSLFEGVTAFDQDIGPWDVSNVTDMNRMFEQPCNFNNGGSTGINNWNTSNVLNMGEMFSSNDFFNQPIGNWDVSNVTNMSSMFNNADAFDQDLSAWVPTGVTDFTNFMLSTPGLSTTNYDLTLSGWAQLSGVLQTGLSINFGGSQYSTATGEQYRNILTAPVSRKIILGCQRT
jgi:surface protein